MKKHFFVIPLTLLSLGLGCASETPHTYTMNGLKDMKDAVEVFNNVQSFAITQKSFVLTKDDKNISGRSVEQLPSVKNNGIIASVPDVSVKFPGSGLFGIATDSQITKTAEMVANTNNNMMAAIDIMRQDIESSRKNTTAEIANLAASLDGKYASLNKGVKAATETAQQALTAQRSINTSLTSMQGSLTALNSTLSDFGTTEMTVIFKGADVKLSEMEKKRVAQFIDKVMYDNRHKSKLYIAVVGNSSVRKNDYTSYSVAKKRAVIVGEAMKKLTMTADYDITVYGAGDTLAKQKHDHISANYDNVLIIVTSDKSKLDVLPKEAAAPVRKKPLAEQVSATQPDKEGSDEQQAVKTTAPNEKYYPPKDKGAATQPPPQAQPVAPNNSGKPTDINSLIREDIKRNLPVNSGAGQPQSATPPATNIVKPGITINSPVPGGNRQTVSPPALPAQK